MASIKPYALADGSKRYECQVSKKKSGRKPLRKSQTFATKKEAERWGKQIELEWDRGTREWLKSKMNTDKPFIPIKDVLEEYSKTVNVKSRSKLFDITKIMTYDISSLSVYDLTAKDLIDHINWRNETVKPQTAANDLIWLSTAIKYMSISMDYNIDYTIFEIARDHLRKAGKIAKSTERDRLITSEEVVKLSKHFKRHNLQMYYIFWFAMYTARRQDEISKLLWNDINHDKKTMLIRDLKHPQKNIVINPINKHAKIPASAYKILQKLNRRSLTVFSLSGKSISKYFTDACKYCGIVDLHFHDLRHVATTHLFRKGLSIEQVRLVTLHKDLKSLQRYINLQAHEVNI
jgi:integrase